MPGINNCEKLPKENNITFDKVVEIAQTMENVS